MEKIKALNIGCGNYPINNFINVDICPKNNVVLLMDAGKPFVRYDNNTFNYIYSCHLIEHLTILEFENYLSETYRVLKPNGVHRICFPSLDMISKIINNPENYTTYIRNIFNHNQIKKLFKNTKILKDINSTIEDKDLVKYYSLVITQIFNNWEHKNIFNIDFIIDQAKSIGYKYYYTVELNKSKFSIFNDIEKNNGTFEYLQYKQYESSCIELIK